MTLEDKKNQNKRVAKLIKAYDLKNKSRELYYVWNRQYLYLYLRSIGYTFQEIADMIKVNHATVIHGCKKAENLMSVNDDEFMKSTYNISKDISDLDLQPVWVTNQRSRENVFLTLINRIFEARDMQDVEALKAFINENINPSKLK